MNYKLLTNQEVGKLPLQEFQKAMYDRYRLKVFGYRPRGGKSNPNDVKEETIARLYDLGKKETASHLAWYHFGAGDYKYAGLTTNKKLYDR